MSKSNPHEVTLMTLAKVVRKGSYQGVPQWGISTGAEITPSKATAEKWASAENALHQRILTCITNPLDWGHNDTRSVPYTR